MQRARISLAALLLLCAAIGGSHAQSEEAGASIIQTTLMGFRVTGDAASNFTTATQTKFSDQLRSLLQPFNFMSIAVQDYTVRPSDCVNTVLQPCMCTVIYICNSQ